MGKIEDTLYDEEYYVDTYNSSTEIANCKSKASLYDIFKRIMDIILALIGLVIGIPLIIIFGIAIAVESPGGIFYTQDRLGKDGKVFKIYKLRSMVCNAEKYGAQWAEKDDPRVTKV